MKQPLVTGELAPRIVSGASLMVLLRLATALLGVVSTVILARLLSPQDFGIVAMATTVIAFIEVFTMNSFSSAIIQNPAPNRDDYDTAWTMEVLLGASAAIAIAALAVPASIYFRDDQLVATLLVLALYPLLDCVYNVGCIDFRKHMEFHKDFALQASRKLSGFAVCIPLAFVLRDHWALVFGMLAGRFGYLVASYLLHPFRPRWSLGARVRIWRFSRWIMISNGLEFLNTRLSHLVLGRLSGAGHVGLYSVSLGLATIPASEFALPINRVVFPGYSRLQHDANRIRQGYLKVSAVVALVTIPAGVGIAIVAPALVPLALGTGWTTASPLIQILALGGAVSAVQANVESLYFAKNLTRMRAQMAALQVGVTLPLMIWLVSSHGVIGAAWAFLATTLVTSAYNVFRAAALLGASGDDILQTVWRPVLACLVMALVTLPLSVGDPESLAPSRLAAQLLLQALTGALVYTLVVVALWRLSGRPNGAERFALDLAGCGWRRIAARSR
ncbi:MAG: lipopolysaccharide biosynthesis protein [Burkholderiaceae bacterium]|nr:lipopolysaccharide biosynthesis protein [Burkholderiaceae bacterium]